MSCQIERFTVPLESRRSAEEIRTLKSNRQPKGISLVEVRRCMYYSMSSSPIVSRDIGRGGIVMKISGIFDSRRSTGMSDTSCRVVEGYKKRLWKNIKGFVWRNATRLRRHKRNSSIIG